MVKINECNVGDVCWIILKNESKPVYGTIVVKHEKENAIQVMTDFIGFRTVLCDYAFWNEKHAKEFKKLKK
jgi:hypothetical protein